MPAIQKTPGKEKMRDYMSRGYSYREMSEKWRQESGIEAAPSAFSMAARRLGIGRGRKKYNELIPWQPIWSGHNMAYHLQRLRWEAARRKGKELDTLVQRRLDKWKSDLRQAGEVTITYDYESVDGFYVVPRRDGDVDMGEGIWIRPPA